MRVFLWVFCDIFVWCVLIDLVILWMMFLNMLFIWCDWLLIIVVEFFVNVDDFVEIGIVVEIYGVYGELWIWFFIDFLEEWFEMV